jgi:hypothetical protein
MIEKKDSISLKGKKYKVNSCIIDNKNIVITGKLIKTARLKSEWYEDIDNPEVIITELKKNNLKVDLFTFMQRLPETVPKFNYYMVWDNVAAIPIDTFDKWINSQIKRQVRNKIKKSIKQGVTVKKVTFDDDFIKGLMNIINETPIRQGHPYWHYGKDFDTIKKDHMTYLENSTFFGAYYKDELIGFIKLINVKNFVRSMGLVAMIKHRDKAPMNALIAKAVEFCADNKIPYLMYDKAVYGHKKESSLYDFKQYNGYKQINLPRYYIPLTLKGKISIKLKLYRRLNEYFPERLLYLLLDLRTKYYSIKYFDYLK